MSNDTRVGYFIRALRESAAYHQAITVDYAAGVREADRLVGFYSKTFSSGWRVWSEPELNAFRRGR